MIEAIWIALVIVQAVLLVAFLYLLWLRQRTWDDYYRKVEKALSEYETKITIRGATSADIDIEKREKL